MKKIFNLSIRKKFSLIISLGIIHCLETYDKKSLRDSLNVKTNLIASILLRLICIAMIWTVTIEILFDCYFLKQADIGKQTQFPLLQNEMQSRHSNINKQQDIRIPMMLYEKPKVKSKKFKTKTKIKIWLDRFKLYVLRKQFSLRKLFFTRKKIIFTYI